MTSSPSPSTSGQGRVFLFLQGPHGPFFNRLSHAVRATGADTWRIGFNAGDAFFWQDHAHYLPFKAQRDTWAAFLEKVISEKGVTDIVLYGDTRWMHAEALKVARRRHISRHIFEEGYLRPYWVTYERNGANGYAAIMQTDIAQMQSRHTLARLEPPVPPSHWGDTRQHVFYGALYHGFVMFLNRAYPAFRPHRTLNVRQEFALHLRRLLFMPLHAAERRLVTRRIKHGGFPYHVVLLQLAHDASFLHHGPYRTQTEFLRDVMQGFAAGAPVHHHLIFKAHPLEDGRTPLARDIARLAKAHGLSGRVHFVRGGKLAHLLDSARTAVTVNSTAGQQALWRGIPLRPMGTAVYNKPELVSDQPLAEFFANPARPDRAAYAAFRDYLLRTSQLPGGFYARAGRIQIVRRVVDLMLAPAPPRAELKRQSATGAQQLRVINAPAD